MQLPIPTPAHYLKTFPAVSVPRPRTWTCAEFHNLGEAGWFEGRRAKLIDGVIVEEGVHSPVEAWVMCSVHEELRKVFGEEWWVRSQMPLVFAEDLDPCPDHAVVVGPLDRYSHAHPTSAVLVVETADASLDYDAGEKRLVYAKAGIKDYWVLDVNARRLLVFRDPSNGDYPPPIVLAETESVTPLVKSDATIPVADLLP